MTAEMKMASYVVERRQASGGAAANIEMLSPVLTEQASVYVAARGAP